MTSAQGLHRDVWLQIKPKGSMYPMIRYLGFGIIVVLVLVLGKYMIIRYLDP